MATPGRAPSSRALRAEQTRQQIIATAQRMFRENGYDATSLQQIADEMGLTKAAVYYHFRAKEDILEAAVKPGIEGMSRLLDEAERMPDLPARRRHISAGYVDFLVANRHNIGMAGNDPATKRHPHPEADRLRDRALLLLYGPEPTDVELICFMTLFQIPMMLSELADRDDEALGSALLIAITGILGVPAG